MSAREGEGRRVAESSGAANVRQKSLKETSEHASRCISECRFQQIESGFWLKDDATKVLDVYSNDYLIFFKGGGGNPRKCSGSPDHSPFRTSRNHCPRLQYPKCFTGLLFCSLWKVYLNHHPAFFPYQENSTVQRVCPFFGISKLVVNLIL